MIIRAIGPELTQFGITNALADTTLELHNQAGAVIATNDDWQTTMIGGIIGSSQVSDIQNSGGRRRMIWSLRSLQRCHRVATPRSCVVLTIPLELPLWKCTI